MSLWVYRAAVVMTACLGLAGCSADASQQEISGAVTLDDQPVKDGHIRFAPVEGKTASAEAFVKDGTYTTKLTVGSYKVEIYAPRSTGKMVKRLAGPGEKAEQFEETIPARYNTHTGLKVGVTKEKKEYNFSLKTKQ
jgi:hypothetical protein